MRKELKNNLHIAFSFITNLGLASSGRKLEWITQEEWHKIILTEEAMCQLLWLWHFLPEPKNAKRYEPCWKKYLINTWIYLWYFKLLLFLGTLNLVFVTSGFSTLYIWCTLDVRYLVHSVEKISSDQLEFQILETLAHYYIEKL